MNNRSGIRCGGRIKPAMLLAVIWLVAGLVVARAQTDLPPIPGPLGWITNGPAVFRMMRLVSTNTIPMPSSWTNPSFARMRELPRFNYYPYTNAVFVHFLPESLNHLVWTNLIGRTNGRSTQLWSERAHPTNWPASPPSVRWNSLSLLYGWRGWTAISPCWEGEVSSGQIPITALTRRHGYTRGHGMGADGFSTNYVGREVWFLTDRNELVTIRILRQVVRIGGADARTRRDYTIFLFDQDLPAGIEPVSVAEWSQISPRYSYAAGAPLPMLRTEQGGNVSADLPGFSVSTWKGGDSGSPDLLPFPNELVFVGGRSTTGPTLAMQADMDELCRLQSLDPQRYQMRWVDVSRFPDYSVPPK